MELKKAILLLLLLLTFSPLLVLSSGTPNEVKTKSSSSSDPNWSSMADLESLCRLTPNPQICEKIGIQGGSPEEGLVLADFPDDKIQKILGGAQAEVLDICNKTAHQSTCVLWYYVGVDATAASSCNKTLPPPPPTVTVATVLEMEISVTKDLARGLGAELAHHHKSAVDPKKAGEMCAQYGRYGELFGKAGAEMEAAEEGLRAKDMVKVQAGIRSALAYNKECKEEVANGVGQVHAEAQFSNLGQSEANSLSTLSESLVKMIRYTTKIDVLGGICMALAIQVTY